MNIKLKDFEIGNDLPLTLIAGPCVIENEKMILETAEYLKTITEELGINFIFKSSYRKANRTSLSSFSGLEISDALSILRKVKEEFNLPILTDMHVEEEADLIKDIVDVIQIPAFLCRQTDLLIAAAKTGKIINIKKGQFVAPEDMEHSLNKVVSSGNNNVMLTERGSSFGYHNLVVDMRSFPLMKDFGYPVIMDGTHSVQIPSDGKTSGGQPRFIEPLSKAAVSMGIAGLFLEVHPDPPKAFSDAGSQLKLDSLKDILERIIEIDKVVKK